MIAGSGRRVFRTGGLTAGRGIPGAGGIRITPPGRQPRSSARASACSPSCGGIPPPSGSRRPGCGPVSLAQGETEAPGGLEHLPQAVLRGRAGESGRCVSLRETRHFSQRGCQAAALSRIPARTRAAASLRGVPPPWPCSGSVRLRTRPHRPPSWRLCLHPSFSPPGP